MRERLASGGPGVEDAEGRGLGGEAGVEHVVVLARQALAHEYIEHFNKHVGEPLKVHEGKVHEFLGLTITKTQTGFKLSGREKGGLVYRDQTQTITPSAPTTDGTQLTRMDSQGVSDEAGAELSELSFVDAALLGRCAK